MGVNIILLGCFLLVVFIPLVIPGPPIHPFAFALLASFGESKNVVSIGCPCHPVLSYFDMGSLDWCGMEECNRICPFRKLHTKLHYCMGVRTHIFDDIIVA